MDEETTIVPQDGGPGQAMFVGRYEHLLDPKRRLTIPSEWRSAMGRDNSLYALPDVHEPCLCLFPAYEIVSRLRKMRQHSIADRKARLFARIVGSRSQLLHWDSQGRIRIQDDLLAFAGLESQVLLYGALDRIELWSPEQGVPDEPPASDLLAEAARYVGF